MGSKFVMSDPGLCIGCKTCMAACLTKHDVTGDVAKARLNLVTTLSVSAPIVCHHCEAAPCASVCPTHALYRDGNRVAVGAEPLNGLTNQGELCLKGLHGYDFINDTKILTPRIYHPMIRETKGAPLKRVSWDTALDFVAQKLTEIKVKYGPDSIMTTGSSRGAGNESNLAMQRFARACLGINNIDNCARA